MKTDKELLTLWDNKENSFNDWFNYDGLLMEEKARLFDLLKERNPLIETKIKEEIYKYTQKNSRNANKQLKL